LTIVDLHACPRENNNNNPQPEGREVRAFCGLISVQIDKSGDQIRRRQPESVAASLPVLAWLCSLVAFELIELPAPVAAAVAAVRDATAALDESDPNASPALRAAAHGMMPCGRRIAHCRIEQTAALSTLRAIR
jgi:hypothetical protein